MHCLEDVYRVKRRKRIRLAPIQLQSVIMGATQGDRHKKAKNNNITCVSSGQTVVHTILEVASYLFGTLASGSCVFRAEDIAIVDLYFRHDFTC